MSQTAALQTKAQNRLLLRQLRVIQELLRELYQETKAQKGMHQHYANTSSWEITAPLRKIKTLLTRADAADD